MYQYATGWLKWPPEVALVTPFPDIELALAGLGDFLAATTPGAKPRRGKPKSTAELKSRARAAFGLGTARGAA